MMSECKVPKTRPNALQHGAWAQTAVLPGEDPREFDRLHRGLIKEWSPSGPAEGDAIFTLAKCIWRKRRIEHLREEVAGDERTRMISGVRSFLRHGRLGQFSTGEEEMLLLGLFDDVPEEDGQLLCRLIYSLRKKHMQKNTDEATDPEHAWDGSGFPLVEPLLTKAIAISDGFSMPRLTKELALEEHLDRLIDRALRRLGQMKAMKEVIGLKQNAPKALTHHAGPDGFVAAPSIQPAG